MGYYEWLAWAEKNAWDPTDAKLLNWNHRDGQPPLDAQVIIPQKDKKGGDPADWPEFLNIREFPSVQEICIGSVADEGARTKASAEKKGRGS
jgi:hypothetical protein